MKREYVKWFSPRLNREMELLIFGDRGARVLVFPTREGRFFDYEDWGLAGALSESVNAGHLQLFCVDSLDSEALYCRHCPAETKLARQRQWESYVLEEVLPFSEWKNQNPHVVAHGCSIGAYHAVTLALRHPSRFCKVVGLSGRYDLTKAVGPFDDLFRGVYSEDIYFHMPNHFVPNLSDEHVLSQIRRMEVVLAVGMEDPFCESNLALAQSLEAKGIPARLHLWEGEAHRARYWRQMVRHYL